MRRIKITYKMAIILATMSFGPMLAGSLTGMLAEDPNEVQRNRAEASRQIASDCSNYLITKDQLGLQRSCRKSLTDIRELRSIRILRHDGLVLFASPDHDRHWTLTPESPSTTDQIRVPLLKGDSVFAELEAAFQPASSGTMTAILRWLIVIGVGFGLNFGSFSLFLNRALSVLDPKSAVPKRVRNTLDTIVGGVVILDPQGKILLVNDSFAKSTDLGVDELMNRELSSLPWVKVESETWPWESVIQDKQQRAGIKLQLRKGDERLTFMVNATPVFDGQERITGALISFEDISLMEEQRQHLLTVLSDLETSKEQIRRQNEVLHELATRDGLTGALNRRALFEKFEALWEDRNDGDRGLITIMMDVDHFKKLNDQHGHSAGDAVLKDVVKTVSKIVEGRATLGRYGGEEFCVIMQRASLEEGASMAEEIRAGIQEKLADPYRVTASLGVSSSIFGAPTIQSQIEQSDQGLYAAKHGGRNAVRCWSPALEEEAKEAERKKAAKLASVDIEEHPISYHAVVTLNSAMFQRFPALALHSHRVAEISVALGRGLLPVGQLYVLEIAAMLHDVGCLGLDSPESQWISMHANDRRDECNLLTSSSLQILEAAFQSRELLETIQSACIPYSEGGSTLPIGSRIIAIANAYDRWTSDYVGANLSHEEAVERLRQQAGKQLDPDLVEKFVDSPIGWRPSFATHLDFADGNAVMIGYQIERVIHSFESGNAGVLKTRLEILQALAKKMDMPMIGMIIQELKGEVERKAAADWASLVPMLQDLVEMCLTIQRAYLRSTVGRPSSFATIDGETDGSSASIGFDATLEKGEHEKHGVVAIESV